MCKQICQKITKITSLLFSDDSAYYNSSLAGKYCLFDNFVELVYNLSEQGKEFLDVSAPDALIKSFQLTRDLTNRQVVDLSMLLRSILLLYITPLMVSLQVRYINSMTFLFWNWSAVTLQPIYLYQFVTLLLHIFVLGAK